jgi:hypothetical protein
MTTNCEAFHLERYVLDFMTPTDWQNGLDKIDTREWEEEVEGQSHIPMRAFNSSVPTPRNPAGAENLRLLRVMLDNARDLMLQARDEHGDMARFLSAKGLALAEPAGHRAAELRLLAQFGVEAVVDFNKKCEEQLWRRAAYAAVVTSSIAAKK